MASRAAAEDQMLVERMSKASEDRENEDPEKAAARALQDRASQLRAERLAAALRDNLRRRKAQARGRRDRTGPDEDRQD